MLVIWSDSLIPIILFGIFLLKHQFHYTICTICIKITDQFKLITIFLTNKNKYNIGIIYYHINRNM